MIHLKKKNFLIGLTIVRKSLRQKKFNSIFNYIQLKIFFYPYNLYTHERMYNKLQCVRYTLEKEKMKKNHLCFHCCWSFYHVLFEF